MWLEDGETDAGLGGSANMLGRNKLGCQDPQCVCELAKEFARGEEAAKIIRRGRMVIRPSIDVSEISRRAESDPGSRDTDGIPVRIVNGRGGRLTENDMGSGAKRGVRSMLADSE